MNLSRALFLHDLITDEEIDVLISFTSWSKVLRGRPLGTAFHFVASSQRY